MYIIPHFSMKVKGGWLFFSIITGIVRMELLFFVPQNYPWRGVHDKYMIAL